MIIGIIWLSLQEIHHPLTSQGNGNSYHVKGESALHGVMRPIKFDVTTTTGNNLKRKVTLSQKDFGIKPYKALFGTLKVKN